MDKQWQSWFWERKRFCCLAAVLVVLGWILWAGTEAPSLPSEGEAAMAQPPALERRDVRGLQLAQQTDQLKDPFTAWHMPRIQQAAALPAECAAPAKYLPSGGGRQVAAVSVAATAPQKASLRLTGILSAESGTLAIFSCGGQSFTLSPGEQREDIRLVSIGEEQAVVDTITGRQLLQLEDSGRCSMGGQAKNRMEESF